MWSNTRETQKGGGIIIYKKDYLNIEAEKIQRSYGALAS